MHWNMQEQDMQKGSLRYVCLAGTRVAPGVTSRNKAGEAAGQTVECDFPPQVMDDAEDSKEVRMCRATRLSTAESR